MSHKTTRRAFFCCCSRRKSLGNPHPPKKPHQNPNKTGGQLQLVQIPRKQDFRHSVWLSAAVTTVTVIFHERSKDEQNQMVLVVGWETSTGQHRCYQKWWWDFNSLWATAQLLPLPRAREVLPFKFLIIQLPTALFNTTRALFPASWPNSTWGNYILPT